MQKFNLLTLGSSAWTIEKIERIILIPQYFFNFAPDLKII
jgi:hypothetical protein